MAPFDVKQNGFDDLQNDMLGMAVALENGAAVNRALEAGAARIEERMRSNASSNPKVISGDLRSAIHTGPVKRRRGGGKRITIGVHRRDWNHEAYYPAYVEYGHGGPAPAPPHPYIRPAFDTGHNDAYSEIRRVLREELK